MKLFLLLMCAFTFATHAADPPRIVAYVPNWIGLLEFVPKIEFKKLTHLNLAFENPINDAGDLSFNPSNTLLIEAALKHRVKILLSIGGGSASNDPALLQRYATLLDSKHRTGFISKLSTFLTEHHFDGLDVDLEGPAITADYAPFIAELSTALQPHKLLLTAALSHGYGGDKIPSETLRKFHFINIMAYDASGPWNPNQPGQHSSLAFAQQCVDYWLGRDVPATSLNLGVPFYGYGFGAAYNKSGYPYHEILTKFPNASDSDQAGDTIFYNGPSTIKAKVNLVKKLHLGGIMIWSLDSDGEGKSSLLSVIHTKLNGKP